MQNNLVNLKLEGQGNTWSYLHVRLSHVYPQGVRFQWDRADGSSCIKGVFELSEFQLTKLYHTILI